MIAVIIQARMGSTRLPGKVLKDIAGRPMLAHVLRRVERAELSDEVVIATTVGESDDPIVSFCEEKGVSYYRGSEEDVLDRYYKAAKNIGASDIIRVTSDCPLIDPNTVDEVVDVYLEESCEYASNTIERTYPDGLDVEVFSHEVLEEAWNQAKLRSEREHVTPYIWKNDDLFEICHVKQNRDLSDLRWTVDEPEDLEFVREVYSHLSKKEFGFQEVLGVLEDNEHLTEINSHIEINEGYQKSIEEDRKVWSE